MRPKSLTVLRELQMLIIYETPDMRRCSQGRAVQRESNSLAHPDRKMNMRVSCNANVYDVIAAARFFCDSGLYRSHKQHESEGQSTEFRRIEMGKCALCRLLAEVGGCFCATCRVCLRSKFELERERQTGGANGRRRSRHNGHLGLNARRGSWVNKAPLAAREQTQTRTPRTCTLASHTRRPERLK